MQLITILSLIRKRKKEEARKAEQTGGDSEDDCSARQCGYPRCKRPTGKQVRIERGRIVRFDSIC